MTRGETAGEAPEDRVIRRHALSKGVVLRGKEPAEEAPADPSRVDLGAGSLKFGAQGVQVTFDCWSGGQIRLEIDAWTPVPT